MFCFFPVALFAQTFDFDNELLCILMEHKAILKLESYGLYKNGKEINKYYPKTEETLWFGNGKVSHLGTMDGHFIYDAKIEGVYLYLTNQEKKTDSGWKVVDRNYFSWIKFVRGEIKGNDYIVFTISKEGIYRYYKHITSKATANHSSFKSNTVQKPKQSTSNKDQYYYINCGDNGNVEMWEHPDGTCTIQQKMKCYSCRGTLKCNICYGTGNSYAYISRYMPCTACGATGNCSTCKGKGFLYSKNTFNSKEAEAYMKAHRTIEAEYKKQKYSRNGNINSDNNYMETVEYAPNYTGLEDSHYWCEKCKKFGRRHSHIRKPVR